MKKSILIGALAVMMLFAFTACEPQIAGVIPGGDSPVAKVTFVSANDPLREGTAPGMVNAVVDVIYKDGTSTNKGQLLILFHLRLQLLQNLLLTQRMLNSQLKIHQLM